MSKIKKRSPMKPPEGMERNFQQVYDDLNDIINAVNYFALSSEEYEGKPGDMKIIKDQQVDGTSKYYLRVKTDDGWVQLEGSLVG